MQTQSKPATPKRKVFISYHHRNDQCHKQALLDFNEEHGIFIDASVDTGDIDDSLSNQAIRRKIRDEYLANSTVTILLVGTETKYRKHSSGESACRAGSREVPRLLFAELISIGD